MTPGRERFIRPSSLSAIAACPARPTLEAAFVHVYGEPESSHAAQIGTDGHAHVAAAINAWKAVGTAADWGAVIAGACNDAAKAGMDQWTVTCIQRCVEFARDLISKHDIDPENVLVEHRLDMESVGLAQPGTADLVLAVPFRIALVVDWKLGFVEQEEAANHDQLAAYAMAAACTFQAAEVEVYLYQPRAEPRLRATAASFDSASLRDTAAWTRSVVERARSLNPPVRPGYVACQHCRALPRCRAAKEYILNSLEALSFLGTPSSAEAWAELVSTAKLAERLADTAIAAAKGHMQAGGEVTGWKLRAGRPITRIDAARAVAIARERGVLDDLLRFVSVRAEAADALPLGDAVTVAHASPSIVQDRASRAVPA